MKSSSSSLTDSSELRAFLLKKNWKPRVSPLANAEISRTGLTMES